MIKGEGYTIYELDEVREALRPINIKAFLDDPLGYSESLKWIKC